MVGGQGFASGGPLPAGSGDRLLAALSERGCPSSLLPHAEARELLTLLQRQGFAPRSVDDRPIVNVWSPRFLGGPPGSE